MKLLDPSSLAEVQWGLCSPGPIITTNDDRAGSLAATTLCVKMRVLDEHLPCESVREAALYEAPLPPASGNGVSLVGLDTLVMLESLDPVVELYLRPGYKDCT